MLLWYIDPSPCSSDHCLSINCTKSKPSADIQSSSIGYPHLVGVQIVTVRSIGNQILDVPPGQFRTVVKVTPQQVTYSNIGSLLQYIYIYIYIQIYIYIHIIIYIYTNICVTEHVRHSCSKRVCVYVYHVCVCVCEIFVCK